jgi:phospholipid/cholesterol/gamma-HCH transport system substrate-binding protein
MNDQEKTTLLRVGIFLAIGLAIIGGMVVYFGRFGDAVRGFYRIRAEFADASGIYKGASVLLAGAKVGLVENNPVILPNMDGVAVDLKIYENVEIPGKAEFLVGSSGLLGDKFIQVVVGPGAKDSPPIAPGSTVRGRTESGIGDLTTKAGAMMEELQATVANIKSITEKLDQSVFTGTTVGDLNETIANLRSVTTKIDREIFTGTTVGDLNATIANLRQATAAFAETSKKLDSVLAKVDGAVGTGDEALKSAKAAADEVKKAVTDVRGLVNQARQGRGALGVLLSDREVADNLRALVRNLRRHGILFYKDRAAEQAGR